MDKIVCVVEIINSCKLALNIGEVDGVRIGDTFLIYSVSKDEILDPITKKSLGKLEVVKGKGKVVYVQEQMCTIESLGRREKIKTVRNDNPLLSGSLLSFYNNKTEEFTEEITIPFENPKIGDLAKEI